MGLKKGEAQSDSWSMAVRGAARCFLPSSTIITEEKDIHRVKATADRPVEEMGWFWPGGHQNERGQAPGDGH